MKLKIELLSDLCTYSGETYNSSVDIDVVYDVLGFLVDVRLLVRPILSCPVLSAPCLPSCLWAAAVALPVAMVIHCGGVL